MLRTIYIALGCTIVLLGGSWLVSFLGFRRLVRAHGIERASHYTSTIGHLTGQLLGLRASRV